MKPKVKNKINPKSSAEILASIFSKKGSQNSSTNGKDDDNMLKMFQRAMLEINSV